MTHTLSLSHIASIMDRLAAQWQDPPSLDDLATEAKLSLSHFQRVFTQAVGISPKKFAQYVAFKHAKQLLQDSRSLLDTALETGLSGTGRLHDLFISYEAMTPGEYKSRGRDLTIYWGFHDTVLGRVLVGQTDRGVCWLIFVRGTDEEALEHFFNTWSLATLVQSTEKTVSVAKAIVLHPETLRLILRGTNFQIKVWEALLRIPSGAVLSYGDIAKTIGHDKAVRAVGTAVGSNPVSFFVPCHRVIQSSGYIENYGGGPVRKRVLLAWEAARSSALA